MNMSQKLYESYEWIVPFESSTVKGKKVIIRGQALHATVSANLRSYIKQELVEFGRTLAGKYIDVNHEYSLWRAAKRRYDAGETAVPPGPKPKLKGHIIDSQYNHVNGFVEYVGEINHPEYAQKIIDRERMTLDAYMEKWEKRPIREVSVDANFRFKRDLSQGLEPHGIVGNGLSLVEDPEKPGVQGTTVEVMEIRETLRLEPQFKILQNLLDEKKIITEVVEDDGVRTLREKQEVKQTKTDEERAIQQFGYTETEWKGLDPETRMSYMLKVKEQDEPEPCPEGEHRNEEGECVPDEESIEEQEGTSTPDKGHDVADIGSEEDLPPEHDCGEGMAWDEAAQKCLPIKGQDAPLLPSLPVDVSPPEFAKVESVAAAEMLHLGEPFADYPDFAACVAANSDKDDPEAYCASIEQQAEGESTEAKISRYAAEVKQQAAIKQIRESIRVARAVTSRSIKDIASLSDGLRHESSRTGHLSTAVNAALAKINAYNATHTEAVNAALNGIYADRDSAVKEINRLGEFFNQLKVRPHITKTDIDEAAQRVTSDIAEKIALIKQQCDGFASALDVERAKIVTLESDTRLDALDTKVTALKDDTTRLDALDEKVAALADGIPELKDFQELFTKYAEEKDHTLTETRDQAATLREAFDQLKVQVENNTERLKKPAFKAGATPSDASSGPVKAGSRMDPNIG